MGRPTRDYGKWRIRWRDEKNERRSAVFDSCEDAEFKLRQITLKVEEIQRGLRLPDLPDKSFDELCTYWLLRRASRKRSGNHDESIIRCHLLPAFGKLKLRHLGIQKVDDFLATKQHLNPKTIANHLTVLISMLNLAKDLHWIESTPRITATQQGLISLPKINKVLFAPSPPYKGRKHK